VVPTPVPAPSVDPRLEVADKALLDGDPELARSELAALSQQEIDSFTAEETELYDELMMVLEGGSRDEAIKDLRGGLAAGSVKMLRRAVTSLSDLEDDEIATEPGLAEDLDRARAALHLRTLMFRAHDSGDSAQLLERATAMIEALPKYSTAVTYRDQAAASLDREAAAAAGEGDYDRAIASLEAIVEFWPERGGVDDRLAGYRKQQRESLVDQAARADYENLLATALGKGEAGAPDEGLRMIVTSAAPSGMSQRRRDVVAALEDRLAAFDGSPPRIELAADTELAYRKNNPAQVACLITDDYRVVKAVAMLRPLGSTEYREVPLSGSEGDRYTVEVAPDVHQNKDVEIYIEAVDVSGQVGRLGSASEPLQLKRGRGLFKRILRK
jgi:tetratricopeptide (TPR) repeat protein